MNCYFISRPLWAWRKKLIFHPLDLIILNSFIILTSYGSKSLHWQLDWHWWGTSYKRQEGCLDHGLQYKEDKPHTRETQRDFNQFTTYAGLFNVSIKWHVCSDINRNRYKIQVSITIHWVVCYPMFVWYKTSFLRTNR